MKSHIIGALFLCLAVVAPHTVSVAAATESTQNSAVFSSQSGSIVDSTGATWTIASSVVYRNGAKAGYSARVIALAYVNHVVWQENADHLWWSWNGSTWKGGSGTATSPFVESATESTLLAGQSGTIIDAQHDAWTIVSGVVKKNGASASYSANVVRIAYVNGVLWQENASHLWWSWNGSGWSGGDGIATSPLAADIAAAAALANNPFTGKAFYTNVTSNALTQANTWRTSKASDATKLDYLAAQPTAVWFGDWNSDIAKDVDAYVDRAEAAGKLPVLVAYAIPNRDCGSGYSSGGVNSASSYHDWVTKFAGAIGTRSAAVILEPDALALDCFDDARGAMLKDAVTVLEAQSGVSVYIDAGHPNWTSAATMATRLSKSGIDNAQGFALNVSNFYSTASNVEFGTALSALVNGKHFVIDTSRNANGWQGEWCNPQGAGVGAAPTATTGTPLFDAGLWIKAPGDSDGNCNGGPSAGAWWSTYALSLYNQGTH